MKPTLLLLATALLLGACKKEINTLPEPTETGANTFGAKINGENWGPLKAAVLPTAPLLEARFTGDSAVVINARNFGQTPRESEMEIYLHVLREPGTYELNRPTDISPNPSASYAWFVKRKLNVEDEWITGSSATGEVVVTRFDRAARILSGRFQFTAAARFGSAPLVVTEGRFDVRLQ